MIHTIQDLREAHHKREGMTKKELMAEMEKRNLPTVKSMSKFQLLTAIFHHDNFINTCKIKKVGIYAESQG